MLTAARPRVFPGWHQPGNLKWRRNPSGERAMRELRMGGAPIENDIRVWDSPIEQLHAIVAWAEGHGWHVSLSHPARYPTWNEIRDARYDLLPDACLMALLLPPRAEYVNLHPNCFHLHEVMQ